VKVFTQYRKGRGLCERVLNRDVKKKNWEGEKEKETNTDFQNVLKSRGTRPSGCGLTEEKNGGGEGSGGGELDGVQDRQNKKISLLTRQ